MKAQVSTDIKVQKERLKKRVDRYLKREHINLFAESQKDCSCCFGEWLDSGLTRIVCFSIDPYSERPIRDYKRMVDFIGRLNLLIDSFIKDEMANGND